MIYSPIGSGSKNITNTGYPTTLVPNSIPANRVDIQAKFNNLGVIYLGGPGMNIVDPAGIGLNPGDIYSFEQITDLIIIQIDGTINGDGVSYNWFIGE